MKKMNMIITGIIGMVMAASAADHSMTGSNSGGTSSFNTGINWDDGQPPVAGNNYFTAGQTMRTPDGDSTSSVHVFAGDSLTVNGGAMAWKSAGACVVTNLIIDGGNLGHWRDWALARLYGNTWINSGKTWRIEATGNNPRDFDIYSQISGPGNILVVMGLNADQASKRTMLHGINTNFTGRVTFERDGQLGFTDERALGPNPPSYVYNQLSIYGGWMLFTNSIAIDDPNRGINLRTSSYDLNGGGFEVSAGATATVSCLINGPGDLGKRGAGTLVLTTNETYTGDTIVQDGILKLAPGATLASSDIRLQGTGSLNGLVSGCTVANLSFEGGSIGVDPAMDDPSTARVTVTGSITLAPFQPITVNVLALDSIQRDFKILDADDLANVAPHDLCVNPPWAGALAIQDNGSGGKVLVLTTQPENKIVYQNSSDNYGHSALLETNWTDHLAPSAGKFYVNNAYGARTPQNGSHTFAGDRLVFDGMGLAMKGSGLPTVNDFVVMNNANMSLAEPPIGRIDGNITLYPILASGRSYSLYLNGWTPLRSFHMYANLLGYGELRMFNGGDPSYGDCFYTLRAMNTNFFGRVRLEGNTNFSVRVTYEENLGGNPPAFRADQLVFNGGGISVTNDVTIDDTNRGITLMADGGVSGTSGDAGGYPGGTPVEDRGYEGGAVFAADAGDTLTIACPITGPGGIVKDGEGDVVLSAGNSYTGLTEIVQGGLAGTTANAFGTGPVSVNGAGRLLTLCSESMPANGVDLGGMIEFVSGGGVKVEMADGATQPTGSFSVPLFLLPEGESINPENVPLEYTLVHVSAVVATSTVGTRTLVSAQFTTHTGTIIMLH